MNNIDLICALKTLGVMALVIGVPILAFYIIILVGEFVERVFPVIWDIFLLLVALWFATLIGTFLYKLFCLIYQNFCPS